MTQTSLRVLVRTGRLVAECPAGPVLLGEDEKLTPASAEAFNYNLLKTKSFPSRFFVLVLLLAAAGRAPRQLEERLGLLLSQDDGAVSLATLQALRCFCQNKALREDLRNHFPVALVSASAQRLLVLERRPGSAATEPEGLRWQVRLLLASAVDIADEAWPLLWERLRAELLPPPAPRIDLHRLPSTPPLAPRCAAALTLLDHAWADAARRVLVITGPAGSGKSTLVNGWTARLCQTAAPVVALGWCFQPDSSPFAPPDALAGFLRAALRRLDQTPESLAEELWVPRLLERLHRQRTLLVLDGLEALLEPRGPHAGRARDERLAQLLHGLVNMTQGLCVITVRPPFSELSRYVDLTALQEIQLPLGWERMQGLCQETGFAGVLPVRSSVKGATS